MKEAPTLGIATVYRSLKALAKDGRVVSVEIPGQMPRYERADKGHHHHFLCRCAAEFLNWRGAWRVLRRWRLRDFVSKTMKSSFMVPARPVS